MVCFDVFVWPKHFVSSGETLCFLTRNTLFLPRKLYLQYVCLIDYDVICFIYDVYYHYLTICFSIIYFKYDVMTFIFSNFAAKY